MRRGIKKLALASGLVLAMAGVVFLRKGEIWSRKTATSARILAEQAYKQAKLENPDMPPGPDIILKETDFELFGNDQIQRCHMYAQESRIFPKKQIIDCRKIRCEWITNKDHTATLHAPKAIIDRETKTVTFPGKVTGTFMQNSSKRWSLEKHDALYNSQTHLLEARDIAISSNCRLNPPAAGISLQAKKSKLDLKNRIVYLYGDVTSTFEKLEK